MMDEGRGLRAGSSAGGASRLEERSVMDAGTPTEGSESSEAAAVVAADGRPRPATGTRIDPGEILGEAWSTFKVAWPACLIIYWGAAAASWLILFVLSGTLESLEVLLADREVTPILHFVRFLGLVMVPAWLWLGQSLAFLKIARRQPVALEHLFLGGRWLLTALLATGVLLAVAAIPCLIIYGSAEGLLAIGGDRLVSLVRPALFGRTFAPLAEYACNWLVVAAASLAVFVGLYATFLAVAVRLGQFTFLIIDRGAGVLESHRLSWELTRGPAASVFLVYLAQLAINLAGLLTVYVGLFVTLPLTSLVTAATYNALCGHSGDTGPTRPGTADEDGPA